MPKVSLNSYYKTALDLHKSGRLKEARKLYAEILRLKPSHLESLFMVGQSWYKERDFEKALDYYNRGLEYQKGNTDILLQKGKTLMKLKRFDEAKLLFDKLVETNESNPQILFHAARSLKETGQLTDAIELYEKVIQINPSHIQALNNLGNLYQETFAYDNSMGCYNRLIELNNQVAMAYCNKAGLLLQMRKLEEAERFYHQALELEPVNALAAYNLGIINNKRYDHDQALQWIEKSIKFSPDNHKYLSGYAATLCSLGKKEKGVELLEKLVEYGTSQEEPYVRLARIYIADNENDRAIQLLETYTKESPRCFKVMYLLGILYDQKQELEKAEIYLNKVSRHPEFALRAHMTLQMIYSKLGRMDKYVDMMNKVSNLLHQFLQSDRQENEIPVYNLAYYPFDPELVRSVTKKFSQSLIQAVSPIRERLNFKYPSSAKKLKIGYLSPYFNNHPAGVLIQGVLDHHDRDKFEVYGYALKGGNDEINADIRVLVDHYTELNDLTTGEAARKINSDGIHILVSLAGYNLGMKSDIPALKPAPVQVICMDCHESMQTDFYDYTFKDEVVLTENNRQFFSESIAVLPPSHFFNSELIPSDKRITREEFGLPNEGFVFGCLSHPRKLSPVALKYWVKILNKTPDSVLWLFDDGIKSFRKNISHAFKIEGIDTTRIIFCGKVTQADHIRRMELIDLFLDTPIYNGHTTCLEALWMSIPVLTIQGNTVSSRLCSSFLDALNLPKLITSSGDEYVQKAIALANSNSEIQELKNYLDSQKKENDFFQPSSLTKKLEAAYLEMWDRYSGGNTPSDFTIK